MTHRVELSLPLAASVLALTAALGGAFSPLQRLAIGTLLIVVWAVAAVESNGKPQVSEVVFVGFVLWGSAVAIWIGAAPLASKETIIEWIVAAALWSLARRGSPRSGLIALRILAVGGTVVAASVMVDAASAGAIRVGGVFENPNVAAAILVPSLPLGAVVFRDRARRLPSVWFTLIGAAVILTGSRAGFLAAIVAAGVLLPRGRIRGIGLLTAVGLALGALVWRFASQPDLLAWHRVSIWWASLKIWATRPVTGVGPGCLVEAAGPERILHADQIGRYQFVIGSCESTPIAILVQVGAVGFLIAVIFLIAWWAGLQGTGVLRSDSFVAGAAAVAALALFHDFLIVGPVLWWWAVVLGCLESSARKVSVPGRGSGSPLGARIIAALALGWLTAWGILTPALARWDRVRGPLTGSSIERTMRIEPWYAEPAAQRVRHLLARDEPWTWETAAESVHWARTATSIHPGLARRWADLGRVHLRVLTDLGGTDHDATAARTAFDRACELDPHLPWYWLERARMERVLGHLQEALSSARRALSEEPNTVRGWLMMSRLELEGGKVGAARDALHEAVTRAGLIDRAGLTDYERELLLAPTDQLAELERILGQSGDRSASP